MYETQTKHQSTDPQPLQHGAEALGTFEKKTKANPYEGTPLSLSGALAGRIQQSFGIDAQGLKLRESQQVADMGARATAQGDAVRFAPGEFQPHTPQGLAVLGHELAHVREQADGGVHAAAGSVYQDAGHEARSDRAGAAFAAGALDNAQASPVGGLSATAAPVQGLFGFGKKKRNKEKAEKAYDSMTEYWGETANTQAYEQSIAYTPELKERIAQAGKFSNLHRRFPRMLEVLNNVPGERHRLIEAFTTGDKDLLQDVTATFIRQAVPFNRPEHLKSGTSDEVIENYGSAQKLGALYGDMADLIKHVDVSEYFGTQELEDYKNIAAFGMQQGVAFLGKMKQYTNTREGQAMRDRKLGEANTQYGEQVGEKIGNSAKESVPISNTTYSMEDMGLFGKNRSSHIYGGNFDKAQFSQGMVDYGTGAKTRERRRPSFLSWLFN